MTNIRHSQLSIFFLVSLLALSLCSTTPTRAARDTTNPVFQGIYLSHGNIPIGETVKVYINATDSQSGVESVVFCLANSLDKCVYDGNMAWNETSGFWETEIQINQYWDGLHTIEHIVITDGFLNIYESELDGGYISPDLNVTGASSMDTTPPTYVSQAFNRSTAYSGDYVKISIDMTDDISNVSYVDIVLWRWYSGSLTQPVQDFSLYYNSTSGFWEADIVIGDRWPAHHDETDWDGYYRIKTIYTADNANNSIVYDPDNGNYVPSVTLHGIIDEGDRVPPSTDEECMNCRASKYYERIWKSVLANNDTAKIQIEVYDSGSGVGEVFVQFATFEDQNTIIKEMYLEFNPITYFWEGTFQLNPYWEGHYVTILTFTDNVGNFIIYTINGQNAPEFIVYDPNIDGDGDGLPDVWETTFGLDPADSTDWNTDYDGDGLISKLEYSFGSDPGETDMSSVDLDRSIDGDSDGLNDTIEYMLRDLGYKANDWDSDQDGIFDDEEDPDEDGLENWAELNAHTNLTDPDTDDDCLLDGFEVLYSNPTVWESSTVDSDGDGLNLMGEADAGSNPTLFDTDSDGLNDYDEFMIYRTDANDDDTDDDLLTDYFEIITYGTNPLNNDTDGDRLDDKFEYEYSESYTDINGTSQIGTIDPLLLDTDGDVLTDFEEVMLVGSWPFLVDSDFDNITDYEEYKVHGTSPMFVDTDNDSLGDMYEIYVSFTDPLIKDTDSDGLNDSAEVFIYFTNPNLNDTDGDGLSDSIEVLTSLTSPFNTDTDNDTLSDYFEYQYGLNATMADTDGDLLPDYWEYEFQLNLTLDDADVDFDNDSLSALFEYYNGTHPKNADFDLDGLNDYYELLNGTDPWFWDSDYDGISDGDEVDKYYSYPLVGDSDGDGLTDYEELIEHNTSPIEPDSDFDGVWDYDEVVVYLTNPWENDTDRDNLGDMQEIFAFNSDPLTNDTDLDGLSDYDELFVYFTIVNNADSDADYLNDADEIAEGTDPFNPDMDSDSLLDGIEIEVGSDPFNNDTDSDTLLDGYEVNVLFSDPTSNDTDNDGMPDVWEAMFSLKINLNDSDEDPDGDNLWNLGEYILGTDPTNEDTDLDGWHDGKEVEKGSDPLDPNSKPRESLAEGISNEPLLSGAAVMALVTGTTLLARATQKAKEVG
ncbi:MAG: hypothetical protein ACXAD7_01335 [Candidatus Kariarchaeaceae archaeon]|jgi:hypothetical protein